MSNPKSAGPQMKVSGAVVYTRVSTGEQDKHGTSPEGQLAACRAKALALSLPIVAEYYDPGISGGFLLSRKEFQAALSAIKSGAADTLICPNIGRYSRDVEHQQAVKKAVRAAGGRLVFCDMEFADTPEGDLNFTIQGGFAEYERKVIRRRTMEGKSRRAAEGRQPARARSPFGYHIVTKADVLRGAYPPEAVGHYQVVEEEARVVREVFARYAAGADTLNGICKWLNASGVRPGGGADLWWPSRVSYILKNAVYKGTAVYGQRLHRADEDRLRQVNPQTGRAYKQARFCLPGDPALMIEMPCPALVDEETWERAGARLAQNPSRLSGNPQRVRMLTGKVCCPACGGRMTVHGSGKNTYVDKRGETREYKKESRYACIRSRHQYGVTGVYACSSASFMIRRTEEAVVTALLQAAGRPEAIAKAVAVYRQAALKEAALRGSAGRDAAGAGGDSPAGLRADLAAAAEALGALEARQTATVRAQIAGVVAGADPAAYAPAFAEIAAERKALKDRQAALARLLRGPRAGRAEAPAPAPPQGDAQSEDAQRLAARALEDAYRVLTSGAVSGADKRMIIATLVDRVVCQPDGADVVFLPGVLPGHEDGGDYGGGPSDGGPSDGGPSDGGPTDGGPVKGGPRGGPEAAGGGGSAGTVRLIDINRNASKSLGVSWGTISSSASRGGDIYALAPQPILFGQISGQQAGANGGGFLSGGPVTRVYPLAAQLDALVGENKARVLSEPSLMVLDGSEGSILVGGEIPVPVAQSSSGTNGSSASVSIEYKQYGVRLSVGAAIVGDGVVELTVTPEVSDLNYAATVQIGGNVIPSLTVRRATSTLQMADGETLVIGGLYSSTTSREVERIPLLSQIPVLGEFFKHTVTRKAEDELLILIQPEIVTPRTAGAHPPAPGSLENLPIARPDVRRNEFDKDFPELQHGGGDHEAPGPAVNLPPLPVPVEPK